MSGGDDWAPGDLALCVKQGVWRGAVHRRVTPGPVAGQVLTVSWAGLSRDGFPALEFADYPTPRNPSGTPIPWRARRFRKINPLTDEERDEFLADLNVSVRENRHA